MLTDHELDWLNCYHQHVWEELSPLVSPRAKAWLEDATKPLSR